MLVRDMQDGGALKLSGDLNFQNLKPQVANMTSATKQVLCRPMTPSLQLMASASKRPFHHHSTPTCQTSHPPTAACATSSMSCSGSALCSRCASLCCAAQRSSSWMPLLRSIQSWTAHAHLLMRGRWHLSASPLHPHIQCSSPRAHGATAAADAHAWQLLDIDFVRTAQGLRVKTISNR